jgi:hypothetical protein
MTPEPTTAELEEQVQEALVAHLDEDVDAKGWLKLYALGEGGEGDLGGGVEAAERDLANADQDHEAVEKHNRERAEAAEARVQELERALREIAELRSGGSAEVIARAALEPPEPTA